MKRPCKSILVTGGAGFIGSAFVRHLLHPSQQFEGQVIILDLLTYAGTKKNLTSVEKDSRYRFYQGDICNQKLVEHLCDEYKIDTIVHFAAETHVDRSIANPDQFIQTNVWGTYSLLEVVRRHPWIHFHHISTDEVFGALGNDGFFDESSPYNPQSPYSASKAASDHLVRAYANTYKISMTLSNCSNNYGPYQFPEKFIPLVILNCLQQRTIPVYGSGQQVRDWLHVEDHVEAIWLIIKMASSGSTFCIGGHGEQTNLQVIERVIAKIEDVSGISKRCLRSLIQHTADRPGHDHRYAINSKRIQEQLGWIPRYDLDVGVQHTVEWYLKNHHHFALSAPAIVL